MNPTIIAALSNCFSQFVHDHILDVRLILKRGVNHLHSEGTDSPAPTLAVATTNTGAVFSCTQLRYELRRGQRVIG